MNTIITITRLFLIIAFLFFPLSANAQIATMGEESLPELNQQRRYSDRRLEAAGEDIVNNLAILNAKFDTSSGHDHDGTDSKNVIGTNLDLTGIDSGDILYNNAGTLAGKTISGLSNVIFVWNGREGEFSNNNYGFYIGLSLTVDVDGESFGNRYEYYATDQTAAKIFLNGRWVKVGDVDTITINARIWAQAATTVTLDVDVGGQSGDVTSTDTSADWATADTIDVSGLTDGNTYDITVTLKSSAGGQNAYAIAVVLTGS